MAHLTIRVPSQHADRVRDSLLHAYGALAEALHQDSTGLPDPAAAEAMHGHRVELLDLDEALEQIGWTPADAPPELVELAAHPEVLSDAVHGALAGAVEALAMACERYWRGLADGDAAAAALEDVATLFALLREVQEGVAG
jgi:hypothetical protein